jgi:rRNA maturation endonuclease Nob1
MPESGAERTRAWRERKCTSEVTVQNVKKKIDLKLNEIVLKGIEYVLVWTV